MLEFAALAFALGLKHSFDADHVIAVSNLLTKARSVFHAARMSVFWAGGHMMTAAAITLLILAFKDSLLPAILGNFELAVAAMLAFLGAVSVSQALMLHSHGHSHRSGSHAHLHMHLGKAHADHSYLHMFGIGVVHGLASNDELLLLLTVSLGAATVAEMVLGMVIFSLGVAVGMAGFASLFTLPVLRARSAMVLRGLNFAIGIVSIGYGLFMAAGIFGIA